MSFTALVDVAVSKAQTRRDEIIAATTSNATPEDSDEWLNVSPEDLEGVLAETGGLPEESRMDVDGAKEDADEEAKAEAQAKKLGKLAKKVEAFIEGRGELEGAVFDE